MDENKEDTEPSNLILVNRFNYSPHMFEENPARGIVLALFGGVLVLVIAGAIVYTLANH